MENRMKKIFASVGRGGKNNSEDVKVIQTLLNQHAIHKNTEALAVDGIIGPQTISRIKYFQKVIVKMIHPDGLIETNGKTFLALTTKKTSKKGDNALYQFSENGIELLKSMESLRCKPYDDQTGKDISYWSKSATIGYGHLISNKEWEIYKNGISEAEARSLFVKDLTPYVNTINESVTTHVAQHQFDAMVILAFNIGVNAFKSSSVLKLINDPDAETIYLSLEEAWKAWNKSQGKVMPGLNKRRNAEWDIYSKNIYKMW